MNKPTEQINKSNKPSDKQRGIGVVELLFADSAIGAAVVAGAMLGPKIPAYQCE